MEVNSTPSANCPLCFMPGPKISRKILLQHLDPLVMMDALKWPEASVCLNPSCQCLYYSDGDWLSHLQCNKRVGFKSSTSPRPFCYCFGHTAEDLLKKGKTARIKTLRKIEAYVCEGGGACPVTNPTGQSCLSHIRDYLAGEKPLEPLS